MQLSCDIKKVVRMQEIKTPKAAQPLGHYSQAISHGGLVYVSTQLGINPQAPDAPPASVEEQTKNCLNNIIAILEAAGTSLSRIVRVTIYLSDIESWDRVNGVYAEFMGTYRPARGIIPVGELHRGFDDALDIIAALADDEGL